MVEVFVLHRLEGRTSEAFTYEFSSSRYQK